MCLIASTLGTLALLSPLGCITSACGACAFPVLCPAFQNLTNPGLFRAQSAVFQALAREETTFKTTQTAPKPWFSLKLGTGWGWWLVLAGGFSLSSLRFAPVCYVGCTGLTGVFGLRWWSCSSLPVWPLLRPVALSCAVLMGWAGGAGLPFAVLFGAVCAG